MTKLLYAMRHCETIFNVQHKTQGWCDSPITPRGRLQCDAAGKALAAQGVEFDRFCCSTAERCCDTMELVCQSAFGFVPPYERMKGLRECGAGTFEGKEDYLEPDFMGEPNIRSAVFKAAGGEGGEECSERVASCLSSIMSSDETQNALVVSSGGALMRFFYNNEATAKIRPHGNSNCVTYVYEWDAGTFSCVDIIYPDFSGIDCGGLGGSGLPNRWRAAEPDLIAALGL